MLARRYKTPATTVTIATRINRAGSCFQHTTHYTRGTRMYEVSNAHSLSKE
jgi:hypothetical protein